MRSVHYAIALQLISLSVACSTDSAPPQPPQSEAPEVSLNSDWSIALASGATITKDKIAVSGPYACLIRNERVDCRNSAQSTAQIERGIPDDEFRDAFIAPPADLVEPSILRSTRDGFCAVARNGIYCWGSGPFGSWSKQLRSDTRGLKDFQVKEGLGCATTDRNRLECHPIRPSSGASAELKIDFGKNVRSYHVFSGTNQNPSQLGACWLDDNSIFECTLPFWVDRIENQLPDPQRLKGLSNRIPGVRHVFDKSLCLIDAAGDLLCPPPISRTKMTFEDIRQQPTSTSYLDLGSRICGVNADEIRCTAPFDQKATYARTENKRILWATLLQDILCYLTEDNRARCRASEPNLETTAAREETDFNAALELTTDSALSPTPHFFDNQQSLCRVTDDLRVLCAGFTMTSFDFRTHFEPFADQRKIVVTPSKISFSLERGGRGSPSDRISLTGLIGTRNDAFQRCGWFNKRHGVWITTERKVGNDPHSPVRLVENDGIYGLEIRERSGLALARSLGDLQFLIWDEVRLDSTRVQNVRVVDFGRLCQENPANFTNEETGALGCELLK